MVGDRTQEYRELLEDCLTAFDALPITAESRRVLRKWGITVESYAGNRSHVLAQYMARHLRAKLSLDS